MNLLKIIRSAEWWGYKLPPLLAIGYATAVQNKSNIYDMAPRFLFLLCAIIVGAIYVSIINDITDIKDDIASGKKNRLAKSSRLFKFVLVSISVLPGVFFIYFLRGDLLSVCLYSLSWISFSLYSIPPFRFKKRGFLGVLADASGAHLFPSLLFVSATSHFIKSDINWLWFIAVGVWAFMYGLRGILWHQFFDKENDSIIGLNTYATSRKSNDFKIQASIIMSIELIALGIMLICIGKLLPWLALIIYLLMVLGYAKEMNLKIIFVVPTPGSSWHILMSSYYQFFLPVVLLLISSLQFTSSIVILFVHLILFYGVFKNVIVDSLFFGRLFFFRKAPF